MGVCGSMQANWTEFEWSMTRTRPAGELRREASRKSLSRIAWRSCEKS